MGNNIFNSVGSYANPSNASLNYYATNNINIKNLVNDVKSITGLEDLFKNKIEGIVSLRLYPYKFGANPPTDDDHKVVVQGTKLAHTYGWLLNDTTTGMVQPFKIYFGYIKIDEYFNSFLDYGNYTRIELLVPFCSNVRVNANEVMGKYLHCYGVVDFGTGKITSFIYKSDSNVHFHNSETLVTTTTGTIGLDIPLTMTNDAELVKNAVSVGTSLVGSVATSFATGNALPLISGAISGAMSFQEHITRSGMPNGISSFYGDPLFRAYITRTNPIYPTNYNSLKGKPSGASAVLNTLTGFTSIKECHLENFSNATKTEIDEIYSLLKQGVIL